MVDYIKQLAADLLNDPPRGRPTLIVRAISGELERLDPRDFLPAARANFVRVKISLGSPPHGGESGPGNVYVSWAQKLARDVRQVLDFYGGDGSLAESRSFAFVTSPGLRDVIERDYRELSLILLPSGAWKSTVVMAGSILEAILYDRLISNAPTRVNALAAVKAPKKRDLSKGEWKLHELIDVAVELGLLPATRADSIDVVLRDYRNFVHPMKEVRAAHPCTEAEALMAKGALDSVCNHLTSP